MAQGSRVGPALGTVVFSIVVPGTVGGLVPQLLVRWFPAVARWEVAWLAGIGWPVLVVGVVGYCWCALDFVKRGWGTPSVTHPPTRLVVSGLYRYSRNPMYVSVLFLIFGQGLLEGSGVVLAYGVAMWCVFSSFVRWYEEPQLLERFGPEYVRYRDQVPRWLGTARP